MSWESCSSQITTFQMFNFFILTALKKTTKKPTSITSRLKQRKCSVRIAGITLDQ